VRNLPRPLSGVARIAAFFASASRRGGGFRDVRECELNGRPAILGVRDGRVVVALMLSVVDGKIRHVFIQADPARLGHVGVLAN
jgi:RNA polymerase sigma-70 factor (ECF subfamily)